MDSPPRPPIQGWGLVSALFSPGHVEVIMPNGYRTGAHLDRTLRDEGIAPALHDRVLLEFSPYDMTQARILRIESGAAG